jgi:hypothetical protein
MTAPTATVLPRRDLPVPEFAPMRTSFPALRGYAPDGESAAAVFLWAVTELVGDGPSAGRGDSPGGPR